MTATERRAVSDVVLTPGGLESLREQLERLAGEREALRTRVRRALDHGGATAENGEYLDAAHAWALLERRAGRLERRFREANVVEAERDGEIDVGERVTVRDVRSGAVATYRIVGSGEADPSAGEVSHGSPIGSALRGRRAGEIVEADVPNGAVRLEILEVDE